MPPDRPFPDSFFRLDSGREWLKSLGKEDRRTIGQDVKTLQFGWPIGMPLARKLAPDLWGVRSSLGPRIARIFFTVLDERIILLHGFVKKTQKTPQQDLSLAKRRLRTLRE